MSTSLSIVLLFLGVGASPVPEEVCALGVGAAARLGAVAPVTAWLSCAIGALMGDLLLALVGQLLRRGVFHMGSARWKTALRGQRWMVRFGMGAIVAGRLVPGLRGAVFLAVGAFGGLPRRWIVVDALAALVHMAVLVGLGACFGPSGIPSWP